jgi:two-component system chemotaxis response regulator CheY
VLRIAIDSRGVRNYYFAEDGKKAVEITQLRSGTLKAAGIGGLDCIISGVVMPGINENMLLRWIRRSQQSPDPFVPVEMISGMFDHKCLAMARDAGVNEFVAKPFSPDIVFKRIQKRIESPRQFVFTPTYLGPTVDAARATSRKSAARSLKRITRSSTPARIPGNSITISHWSSCSACLNSLNKN